MTNENENLIFYKKINNEFILKDKNFLYLGSYLISMEISFEYYNDTKKKENESLNNKDSIKGKFRVAKTIVSEKKQY